MYSWLKFYNTGSFVTCNLSSDLLVNKEIEKREISVCRCGIRSYSDLPLPKRESERKRQTDIRERERGGRGEIAYRMIRYKGQEK